MASQLIILLLLVVLGTRDNEVSRRDANSVAVTAISPSSFCCWPLLSFVSSPSLDNPPPHKPPHFCTLNCTPPPLFCPRLGLSPFAAQGWTITRPQLDHRPAILTGFALFAVAYLALFVWQHAGQDPMSTAYFYDSGPSCRLPVWGGGLYGKGRKVGMSSSGSERVEAASAVRDKTAWFLDVCHTLTHTRTRPPEYSAWGAGGAAADGAPCLVPFQPSFDDQGHHGAPQASLLLQVWRHLHRLSLVRRRVWLG